MRRVACGRDRGGARRERAARHDVGRRRSTRPGPARPVTLLTHDSFDVSNSVLRAFEDESGIDVIGRSRAGDAGQLVSRAILTAGNPEGDVLFGIDDNLLPHALERGRVRRRTSRRAWARSTTATSSTRAPRHADRPRRRLRERRRRVARAPRSSAAPNDLDDLTDPFVPGPLVVENPATSTPGLAFLLATVAAFGEPGTWTTGRACATTACTVVDGWEQAYFGEFSGAGGGEGTRPLVVSVRHEPRGRARVRRGTADDAPTPGPRGHAATGRSSSRACCAGTEHEAEARALIDFLLSRPFQEDIPLRMFVFPVAEDAEPPGGVHGERGRADEPLDAGPARRSRDSRTEWVRAVDRRRAALGRAALARRCPLAFLALFFVYPLVSDRRPGLRPGGRLGRAVPERARRPGAPAA